MLHELGHVVAGRFARFRFVMLGVGPLCVQRGEGGIRLRALPPTMWGPFALSIPTSIDNLSARFAAWTAGGPLASLAIAAVAAVCAQTLPASWARMFTSWLALLSACVFVATAQPFGSGSGIPSDGQRLLSWLRRDPEERATTALVALESLGAAGVRPRDLDPGLVAEASHVRRPAAFALAASTLRLRRALDAGDGTAARDEIAVLTPLLTKVPRWLRADAACEACAWHAEHGNLEEARALMRDARGGIAAAHRVSLAESALLLASGDFAGARRALDHAWASSESGALPATGLDRDRMARLARRLESAAPIGSADEPAC